MKGNCLWQSSLNLSVSYTIYWTKKIECKIVNTNTTHTCTDVLELYLSSDNNNSNNKSSSSNDFSTFEFQMRLFIQHRSFSTNTSKKCKASFYLQFPKCQAVRSEVCLVYVCVCKQSVVNQSIWYAYTHRDAKGHTKETTTERLFYLHLHASDTLFSIHSSFVYRLNVANEVCVCVQLPAFSFWLEHILSSSSVLLCARTFFRSVYVVLYLAKFES